MDLNRHSFEDEGLNLLPQCPELDVWELPFSWEKVPTSLRMAAPSEVRPLRRSAAAYPRGWAVVILVRIRDHCNFWVGFGLGMLLFESFRGKCGYSYMEALTSISGLYVWVCIL